VLAQANRKYPDDVDLLYEQSMMAEKLNRMDEMERLLRRVIELKPDHHHAYNALGYSLAERNVRLPEAKSLIQKALEIAPGRALHHRQPGLGRVPHRQSRGGAAACCAARTSRGPIRDRGAPGRSAVGERPA
jgi:tetratricopeptide (TPR) repeat protein